MNLSWNQFPFLRLCLFFALGIVAGTFLPGWNTYVLGCFLGAAGLYLLTFILKNDRLLTHHAVILGTLAFTLCFSFGYIHAFRQAEKYDEAHIGAVTQSIIGSEVILVSEGKETAKTYGFKARVTRLKTQERWEQCHGNVMLYFRKDSLSGKLAFGDKLLLSGAFQELKPPGNPLEFDYKRFLGFSKVYHQQYVPSGKWIFLTGDNGSAIRAYAIKIANTMASLLEAYISDPRSLAIAKALTLGIKDELDNELRNAYSAAGAMHVLAVSGLHVGIIYMILGFLLAGLNKFSKGKLIFAGISLTMLWAYAFVTGLSPSVLRAATMFSFIIIGKSLQRRSNIYNALAASAFLLLYLNPFLLFSVGFQLSYLAVVGIVYIQPKLYQLLAFKQILWDKVWAITCVSLAAQLTTAPLGLLYFHQFPTYFLLSNLVVIPAAFIILNGSLLLMVLSVFPVVAAFFGQLISQFIQAVNWTVFKMQQFPNSTIDGIYFTTMECWLFYISIFLTLAFTASRKLMLLQTALIFLVFMCFSISLRQFENADEKKMTIFNIDGHFAMAFRSGFQQFLRVSDSLALDKSKLRFHIYPSQLQAGIADFHPDFFMPDQKNDFLINHENIKIGIWQGKKIVHLYDTALPSLHAEKPIFINYLILSNNSIKYAEDILKLFDPELVIIDASNNYYNIQNLKAKFEEAGVATYSIPEQGAFELKI